MKKVIIFSPSRMDDRNYHIELFNELSRKYHLTVAAVCQECRLSKTIYFDIVHFSMPDYTELKSMTREQFLAFNESVVRMVSGYDVAIWPMVPQYRVIETAKEIQKTCRLIFWGIGVAASYNTRFDSIEYTAPSFLEMISISHAVVFYTDYPYKKYERQGADTRKMFVAPNTVYVKHTDFPANIEDKNKILFVGSLYPQKRVDVLIDNYSRAFQKNKNVPDLLIIGDGVCGPQIQESVKENGLEGKVSLLGEIYDEDRLSEYFLHALAVVSPDQAGLSVLKSMGYGAPFITKKDAISGGEIFNIADGVNGVLFDEFSDLENMILDMAEDRDKYIEMGKKAKDFYWKYRPISVKAEGLAQAIEYAASET